MLDTVLSFGEDIYATFVSMLTWMKNYGVSFPIDGLLNPWEWTSIYDIIVTHGLTIIIGAIIIKWIVDFIRG